LFLCRPGGIIRYQSYLQIYECNSLIVLKYSLKIEKNVWVVQVAL
jgi:hypothetical protein